MLSRIVPLGVRARRTVRDLLVFVGLCGIVVSLAEPRFGETVFSIDPSITDQEEKELAFAGIVASGKDVVPAVTEFCMKAETVTLAKMSPN